MNLFDKVITLVVTISLSLFCTVNNSVILTPFTTALKLSGNLNIKKEIAENFSNIFPLFSSFSSLCLASENEELLDIFIKNYEVRNKILTIEKFGGFILENCQSIIFIDKNSASDCEQIVSKHYEQSLYFISVFAPTNLTEVEECVCNSSSSEVVIVYIQENLLFELSDVFHTPRSFIKSNIENVINRRGKSKTEDLGGMNVTGAFVEFPPFAIIRNKSRDEYDGIEVTLFKELAEKLKFTPQFLVYDDWGTINPDGTWENGTSGALLGGKADMVIACVWQVYSIITIMDFGPSIATVRFSLIIRRPEPIDFEWRNFIEIFKPGVWYATLASYLMITACYWFGIIQGFPSYRRDWLSIAVIIFGRFTMTTSHDYFSSAFTRFILTAWSVFALLLTTLLSTGIVSSLTLPLYSPRVDTYKQLLEGGYYWTAQFYADLHNDEIRDSLLDLKNHWSWLFEKKYKYMEAEEVEARAYYDKELTYGSQIYADDIISIDTYGLRGHNNLRSFRVTRLDSMKYHSSFGVKKNSPLLEPLTKMTLRFSEAGLLQPWRSAFMRRWKIHDTHHLLEEHDTPTFGEPEAMRLYKLQPVFYLLLAGLAASFLIFCIEIVFSRWEILNSYITLVT